MKENSYRGGFSLILTPTQEFILEKVKFLSKMIGLNSMNLIGERMLLQ